MPYATPAQIEELLARMQGVQVLVVGDLMLDEYLWGRVERISPEAPVQVVDVEKASRAPGGAANVARNVVALGGEAVLVGVAGNDPAGTSLCELLDAAGIPSGRVVRLTGRPTAHKTRVMAQRQQVVRYDREVKSPLAGPDEDRLSAAVLQAMPACRAVLISDYAKGAVTPRLCQAVMAQARTLGIPVCVDPKGRDITRYRGATLVTPNLKEAAEFAGMPLADDESVERAGRRLREDGEMTALLITRSERGMSLFTAQAVHHIPTRAREVFDVTGAGDTVLACVGLALAAGVDFRAAAGLGNDAAGVVVGKVGAAVATPLEIIQHVREIGPASDRKVSGRAELADAAARLRAQGKRIVFTNGCFDLLHVGHVRYLQRARELGDVLILALNTDASVRRLKGEGRPVVPEAERAYVLSALSCVDYITLFDEDTPRELINLLRPDILVKGGDYKPDQVVGRELVESWGGRVEIVDYLLGHSTTELLKRINSGQAVPGRRPEPGGHP